MHPRLSYVPNDNKEGLQIVAVVKRITNILQETIRVSDSQERYGGEELALLLPQTEHAQAHELAERLRALVEASSIM
ncbi:diguanylate cyclase [Thalassotalea euphylliae]|uniref:diguanylate cyclase n=1 Tax=Thalassotalea euphylliae TaxID=1655234 RepID=UPI0036415D11